MPAVKRTELEVFSGGAITAKNRPNSPVSYPSRPVQPALKPILESFDFVKFSGFRRLSPTQQVDFPGIGAGGAGPGAGSPQAKKKRAEARAQRHKLCQLMRLPYLYS